MLHQHHNLAFVFQRFDPGFYYECSNRVATHNESFKEVQFQFQGGSIPTLLFSLPPQASSSIYLLTIFTGIGYRHMLLFSSLHLFPYFLGYANLELSPCIVLHSIEVRGGIHAASHHQQVTNKTHLFAISPPLLPTS